MIIINADDWGRSMCDTDAALHCFRNGAITSASAMVFMEDSERAAELAKESGIDIGLHLNFTQHFTGKTASTLLSGYHDRIVHFLTLNRYCLAIYNPFLNGNFHYCYQAQIEEFTRLYGKLPSHFDGHNHMHLCSNMLFSGIIPEGSKVRRSFSFRPGEKSFCKLAYRRLVDRVLSSRYRITDYFFALSQQLQRDRMMHISRIACEVNVELMTHPASEQEYRFLESEDYLEAIRTVQTGTYAML